jgi:hypothetical protein
MSYTTEQILRDTQSRPPEKLFFEQIIKTLAEPIVITTLREMNNHIDRTYTDQGLYMVIRGGDALNYYYPINKYIPTHDWDIVLINVTKNIITRDEFNIMNGIVKLFMDRLTLNLTQFFKDYVLPFDNSNINAASQSITPKRNTITFNTYNRMNIRLNTLSYTYSGSGSGSGTGTGSILDLFIGNIIDDGGSDINQEKYKTKFTKESIDELYKTVKQKLFEHYMSKSHSPKESRQKAELNYGINVIKEIQSLSKNEGGTLYRNAIELIVQDERSGMYYIAPGDLLTDTMNMIYLSVNSSVSADNNKLAVYLAKYATLLDVINEFIQLCPDDSCEAINEYIIKRNTDKFVCAPDKEMAKLFEKFYKPSKHWLEISQRKRCEMFTILSYIST